MVAIPIFNCKCTDLFILAFSLTAFKTITDSIDFYPAECENTPMTLRCPSGSSIHINDVLYGRMDRVTCPHQSIHNINCKLATGTVTIHAYLCRVSSFRIDDKQN